MVLWKILPFGKKWKLDLSKDFTLIKIDLPGHGKSKVYQEIHTVELMAEKSKRSN